MDPKDIVEQGYDRIADEYERWSTKATDPARERYLKVLLLLVAASHNVPAPLAPPEPKVLRCEEHPHAKGYWLCLS